MAGAKAEDGGGAEVAVSTVQEQPVVEMEEQLDPAVVSSPADEAYFDNQRDDFLYNLSLKIPRIYFFISELMFPLLLLIGLCFLFGWGLASLEANNEKESNDAVIRDLMRIYSQQDQTVADIEMALITTTQACLANASNATAALPAGFAESFQQCTEEQSVSAAANLGEYYDDLGTFWEEMGGSVYDSITFDWIVCDHDSTGIDEQSARSDKAVMFTQIVTDWLADFYGHLQAGMSESDALAAASGSQTCRTHTAGGALFWFTIMTTIGYGNTAPTTDAGRALIYICGFITIIAFLALNGTAAHVLETLVDDALIRMRLRVLTKGFPASLLWLILLCIWIFVLGGVSIAWGYSRSGTSNDEYPLEDALWFSYITITTVGFGDISIPHDEFVAGDMFYLPLVVLFGFCILGTFATKLIDTIQSISPNRHTLKSVLKKTQPKVPMLS